MNKTYKLKGFTFIELIIAISLSFTSIIVIFNLLLHTTMLFKSTFSDDKILENMSLALDFFEKQIRVSDIVIIEKNNNKNLLTIGILKKASTIENPQYDKHSFSLEKNNSLNFGKNPLVQGVKDVTLNYNQENNFLIITVYPINDTNNQIELSPISRNIDLKYKIVSN